MPLPAVPGQPATLIGSIVTALAYLLSGSENLVTLTHGHVPFDNLSTDYVIPDVQAAMPRYQGHPAAMNYMQRAYQPTGRPRIPMLAVENAFDPVAAGFHRDRYALLLGETGALGLFARVTLPTFGHCPDTAEPTVSAFQQLVAWVETGVRP